MTLLDIIRADVMFMRTVVVEVDSSYSTVCISDTTGIHEDIFMQGEDAEAFIAERDRLYEETGDLCEDVIELHLARPYVETIWN